MNKIQPQTLFLVDSLGALLSAILLGLILARFEPTFGMPPKVVYVLGLIYFVLEMIVVVILASIELKFSK